MRTYIVSCAVVGIVSLFFFILTNLALLDISHGEPDLANEWRAVKVGVFPILMFHVAAIIGLFKVASRMEQQKQRLPSSQ
jgi:uncharacterized BrkB/YihY/UPF0761 family membrane protein